MNRVIEMPVKDPNTCKWCGYPIQWEIATECDNCWDLRVRIELQPELVRTIQIGLENERYITRLLEEGRLIPERRKGDTVAINGRVKYTIKEAQHG